MLKKIEADYYQEQRATAIVTAQLTEQQRQRIEQRRARYEVHCLRSQGYAVLDITHHLEMGDRTVARYLATAEFLEWQPQKRGCWSQLDPYKPMLLEQWNSG